MKLSKQWAFMLEVGGLMFKVLSFSTLLSQGRRHTFVTSEKCVWLKVMFWQFFQILCFKILELMLDRI